MKKLCFLLLTLSFLMATSQGQLLKKLGDKVKNKSEQRADQKVDQTIDKGLDKAEETGKKKDGTSSQTGDNNNTTTNNHNTNTVSNTKDTSDTPASTPVTTFKVYQNYDFVPGDKILFEDNFTDDPDGEFPTHWELKTGQGVLNKIGGEEAFTLTEGNYVKVSPRLKVSKYLADQFTIEYDYYYVGGAYALMVFLKGFDKEAGYDREAELSVNNHNASFSGNAGVSLSKEYPDELSTGFEGKWHHIAIAYKNKQLKVYVDQFRTLVVPDTKESWESIQFGGIGDEKEPIVFKNVRIALGGNMNMIGKKFTDAKIVTHGINFDIDKAIIKPESMGTLNMIVQVMKDNPEIKFEIDGHTDNTGTAAHNLTLSQQRADAVKDQLIKMGIEASRLTSKGYGDTKPMSDNTTLDGRANNRRVEFVKM